MAAALGYSDVIFLRGGHLSCHFLRKRPRACQNAFNDENKNNGKGKMFWLTRKAAGLSLKSIHFTKVRNCNLHCNQRTTNDSKKGQILENI